METDPRLVWERRALSRVEAGSIPFRRDERKFYEFLLTKKKTALPTEQKHRIATEQSIALKGAELVACKKALQAPRSQQEWEDLWSGRRPKNGFQVEDALSKESSSASEAEEEASSDELNPALQFLKGLKEGPKPKAIEGKPKKEEKQQGETDAGAGEQSSGRDEKACKKATDKSWGAAELQDLTRCRDELEDLSVDCHLQGIKDKLIEAGAALKASKKAMNTLA